MTSSPLLHLFCFIIIILFSSLLPLFSVVVHGIPQELTFEKPENSRIIDLTDENFEQVTNMTASLRASLDDTNNNNNRTNINKDDHDDDWLFILHSTSCFHCLTAAPPIETFATEMFNEKKHNVKVAKIDCNPKDEKISAKTIKLCRYRFKVQYFPTILFFFNSKNNKNSKKIRRVVNYINRKRTKHMIADDILEFVTNQLKMKNFDNDANKKSSSLASMPTWSNQRLEEFVESEDLDPNSLLVQIEEFIKEANADFERATRGMFHPIFFWLFFSFMFFSLIGILIVSLCCDGNKKFRRRRVNEILKERREREEKENMKKKDDKNNEVEEEESKADGNNKKKVD